MTGGTGSIGWAVCRDLAAKGCKVVVVDLNEERCRKYAQDLPTKSMGIKIDVSDEESVKAGYARIG